MFGFSAARETSLSLSASIGQCTGDNARNRTRSRRERGHDHGQAGHALPGHHPPAHKRCDVPLAAYQVSGEFSMIVAAARTGWVELDEAL
jgi:hypothetical protein